MDLMRVQVVLILVHGPSANRKPSGEKKSMCCPHHRQRGLWWLALDASFTVLFDVSKGTLEASCTCTSRPEDPTGVPRTPLADVTENRPWCRADDDAGNGELRDVLAPPSIWENLHRPP